MARRDSFGIAPQTDWGTAESTMSAFIPVESVDITHNIEGIEVEETTGTRFPSRRETGTRYGELTVNGPVRVASFPWLLYALIGEPTTDGTDNPAYEHTFDPAGSTPLPVSLLANRTDPDPAITDLFEDAIVNTLSLSCEPNGYLTYSASFVARDYTSDSEPSPSLDFSDRFPFHTLTAYITVDGGVETEIPLAAWSIEYNNNIPTDAFVLGQRTLYEVVEDNADCSVSFTPRTGLEAHYRRALLDDPSAVKIRLVAVGSDIGSGSVPDGANRVEVIVYLCEYIDAPAGIDAGSRMNTIEVTARAAYDDANDKFVDFIVENEVASYEQPVS